MSKKPCKGLIPFDKNGNMLSCADDNDPAVDWRQNTVFRDNLKFAGFYQYKSTIRVIFHDFNGKRLQMFWSEFKPIIKFGIKPGGIVSGTFTFSKRGAMYGIMPVELDKFIVLKEPHLTDREQVDLREYGKISKENLSPEYIEYLKYLEENS